MGYKYLLQYYMNGTVKFQLLNIKIKYCELFDLFTAIWKIQKT